MIQADLGTIINYLTLVELIATANDIKIENINNNIYGVVIDGEYYRVKLDRIKELQNKLEDIKKLLF